MVSLTTPPQTDARGNAVDNTTTTEEQFLSKMDYELAKVEKFTLQKVSELRAKIVDTEKAIGTESKEDSLARADEISNDFLLLEKYVNINFMGFHKVRSKLNLWMDTIQSLLFE
jgi:SPX domain protein involved in polyphosphate accumulation